MDEINGERVDMIEWSEDPIKLISTALQPAAISAVIIVNDTEHLDEEDRKVKKRAAVFVEESQRPMAIGRKGQNIRLATDLTSFELDMYNYDELPAFKAKLAELRGEEIEVVEFETDEDGEMVVKGEAEGGEVAAVDEGKTRVKPTSAKKPEPKVKKEEAPVEEDAKDSEDAEDSKDAEAEAEPEKAAGEEATVEDEPVKDVEDVKAEAEPEEEVAEEAAKKEEKKKE
jgi:hypothetical protein